jgi:hypothetical protein
MKIDKKILGNIKIMPVVNIAIVGSRDFTDYELFKTKVNYLLKNLENEIIIVSGGAKGADSLARQYAQEKNYKLIEFIPDWDTHGKSAGFLRNKEIINQADMCIAFSINDSAGTASSIKLAEKKKIPLRIVKI